MGGYMASSKEYETLKNGMRTVQNYEDLETMGSLIIKKAQGELDWYIKKSKETRFLYTLIRFLVLIGIAIAGLIPILNSLNNVFRLPTFIITITIIITFSIFAFEKYFGIGLKTFEYIKAYEQLYRKTQTFIVEWDKILVSLKGSNFQKEDKAYLFEISKIFIEYLAYISKENSHLIDSSLVTSSEIKLLLSTDNKIRPERLCNENSTIIIKLVKDWKNNEIVDFLNAIEKAYNFIYSIHSFLFQNNTLKKSESEALVMRIINNSWHIHPDEVLKINSIEIHSPGLISFDGSREVAIAISSWKILREQENEKLKQEMLRTDILKEQAEQEKIKTQILYELKNEMIGRNMRSKTDFPIMENDNIKQLYNKGLITDSGQKNLLDYQDGVNLAVIRFKEKFESSIYRK
jgi:hypothetical protein